jgi:hypothetical protein
LVSDSILNHFNQLCVPRDATNEARQLFTKPDSQVHNLIPPAFGDKAQEFYTRLGCPVILCETAWDVYKNLLEEFYIWNAESGSEASCSYYSEGSAPLNDSMELIPGLQNLPFGPNNPVDD